jgi:hypothetical protein
MATNPFGGFLTGINQFMNTAGNVVNFANLFKQTGTGTTGSRLNVGGLQLPQSLLGAGLYTAGALQQEEPGEVKEARQFLRNRFTSPTALTDQFTGQLGALTAGYEPLLKQQEKQTLDQVQQREISGMPWGVLTDMSGPERLALREANQNVLVPQRQALLNNMALGLLDTQGNAAKDILDAYKKQSNPLADALSSMGGYLMSRDLAGTTGYGGVTGTTGAGTTATSRMGGLSGQQLLTSLTDAVGLANTSGDTSQLIALLSSGALAGTPFPIGLQASTPAGQIVQQAINAGLVESPAATTVGGTAGTGGLTAALTSPAALATGAAAGMYGAYQLGKQNENWIDNPTAKGAAIAATIAMPLLAPFTLSALWGANSAQKEQKAMFRQQDNDSQRDQVYEIGNWGATWMQKLGASPQMMQDWQNRINTWSANVASPASEQTEASQYLGQQLRSLIQQANPAFTQGQTEAALRDLQGIREDFVSYMMQNLFSANNSSYAGKAPKNLIQDEAYQIGLGWIPEGSVPGFAKGGLIRPGQVGMVGEQGPEMVRMMPQGAMVMPMRRPMGGLRMPSLN